MNTYTVKALGTIIARNDVQQYLINFLSNPLRPCVFGVNFFNVFTLHKTFIPDNKPPTKLLMSLFFYLLTTFTHAQQIDLLLKNGHVIDPANNINARLDVAVADGKIVKVAPNIATDHVKKIVDVTGLYVCPGFIDIHSHVFVGSKPDTFADGILSLSPDDFTFRAGVTTVVDAGTAGWRNFCKRGESRSLIKIKKE